MKPITAAFRLPILRRHPILLAAVFAVALGGLLAFIYWLRPAPAAPPEPPTVALEGVEKPVADAITAAREQVRKQPASGEAWGYLGMVLMTHRFPPQAEECFIQAEKLDAKQPRWPYYRGLLHLHQDNQLALTHLRRAVELGDRFDPGVVSTRLRLAEALVEVGEKEEAEEQFRIAFKKDPHNLWLQYHRGLIALERNDLDAAFDRLSPLTNHPSARQKACVQLARIYLLRKDKGQADEYARLAAELPPDQPWEDPYVREFRNLQRDAQGRLVQIKALELAGNLQEVVSELQNINEDSDSDLARIALGSSLASLGKYDEAEKALRDTLALYPDKIQAHYFLAQVLFIQGDQVPRKDHGIPEAALEKYRDCAAHARRILELKSDHGLAHLFLGRALLLLGQRDEGLKELQAAVACKPEEARTHYYLGEALADAGQAEEGIHHLELAVRLLGKDEPLPAADTLKRVREQSAKPK
jgi:tetratricopeptide (TPR) repeat protein